MADGALVEPAAVVYRGLASIAVKPGRRALVVGDGTVALLAATLLGLWSPAEIVMLGRRPAQADLAATAGAARFGTDPAAAGGGYDLVVEAAGTTGAVLTALAAARRGGTVLLLGLPRTAPPRPCPWTTWSTTTSPSGPASATPRMPGGTWSGC